MGLVLWARGTLGAMYGVSTSFTAPVLVHHRLIQRGPFAIVRHPMYLGYWQLLLGVALIYSTWTPWVFLVVCLASFYRRAQREEKALAEKFAAEWRGYAARVPMFVPRRTLGLKRKGEGKD
jgi:protein-S-isoprenylcysteine O-methyltransferase Ste14